MHDDVLIIGASGFIGSYLLDDLRKIPRLRVSGTRHRRVVTGLHTVDITDCASMVALISKRRPTMVIFTAGTKDVVRCEREPGFALDLNVGAIRNYITACAEAGLRPATLYMSSDYVFSGLQGSYGRNTLIGLTTVYDLTKLMAERLLLVSGLPGQILRVSAVMGHRGGFFRWLEENLRAGIPVTLFDNTFFLQLR